MVEHGIESVTDRMGCRHADNADAGSDEAVFDRRGAGLIFKKLKNFGHPRTPCDWIHSHTTDALLKASSIARTKFQKIKAA
jgi:hypothetical protein